MILGWFEGHILEILKRWRTDRQTDKQTEFQLVDSTPPVGGVEWKWRRVGCLQWWVGSWYVELQLQWGRVSSNIQLQAATDNRGPLMSEDFWLAAPAFLLLWKVFSVFYRRQINGRQLAAASVQRRSSTSMYTEDKVVVVVVVVEALCGALPLCTQNTT